jgi:NADH-quinone oxidoreductase subunit J
MISDIVLFVILALVAVASALGMLLSRNAIYSALNLILNFCTIAILYLILNAPFIALIQITVYAGAIMVLFLFVIMLLGMERLRTKSVMPWQERIAIVLAVILLVLAIYVIFIRSGIAVEAGTVIEGFGSPGEVGLILFNEYLLPFEVTSILLLVAIVGAIILTMRHKNDGKSLKMESSDGTD